MFAHRPACPAAEPGRGIVECFDRLGIPPEPNGQPAPLPHVNLQPLPDRGRQRRGVQQADGRVVFQIAIQQLIQRNGFALEPGPAILAKRDRRERLGEKQRYIARPASARRPARGTAAAFECEISLVVGGQIVVAHNFQIALMRADLLLGEREVDRLRIAGPQWIVCWPRICGFALGVEHVHRDAAVLLGPQADRVGLDPHLAILGHTSGEILTSPKANSRGSATPDIDDIQADVSRVGQKPLSMRPDRRPSAGRQIGENINLLANFSFFFSSGEAFRRPRASGVAVAAGLSRSCAARRPPNRRQIRRPALPTRSRRLRFPAGSWVSSQRPVSSGYFEPGVIFVPIGHPRRCVENQRRGDRRFLAPQPPWVLMLGRASAAASRRSPRPAATASSRCRSRNCRRLACSRWLNEPHRRKHQLLRHLPHHQMQHDRHRHQRLRPNRGDEKVRPIEWSDEYEETPPEMNGMNGNKNDAELGTEPWTNEFARLAS